MLFIGANALVPGEVDVDAVLRNPHVESSALAFAKAPLHVVPREQKSICVLQSEAATVPWTAEVCLGSQDATTCVIAIIVCQLGCTVLHFDEVRPTPHDLSHPHDLSAFASGGRLVLGRTLAWC